MFCTQCGNEAAVTANFCSTCGHSLREQPIMKNGYTTAEAISLVVGENNEYYIRNWNRKISWNWAGFFLSYAWLGYRKMYLHIVILLGTLLFINIIDMLLFRGSFTLPSFAFSASVMAGMMGNVLYKSHIQRQIKKADLIDTTERRKWEHLQESGGTSIGGVVFGLAAVAAYVYLSQSVPIYLYELIY
ncbi:DUF2628 domain-containing protein [Fredinandcohnia sp. 179-A 10B2 NHS]|uniref:DUF2628 domain-containing protein n=1 Tax=Fredinandcohnia sp. 179-A 10B2 NHS TaxID=3235176 RepID=UPI0039A22A77